MRLGFDMKLPFAYRLFWVIGESPSPLPKSVRLFALRDQLHHRIGLIDQGAIVGTGELHGLR